eukprot:COSAG06_NODE_1232_length_10153_cov_24.843246_10_plen_82_part_00
MPKLWDPYEVRLRQTRSRRRVPAQRRSAHHHVRRRAQLWPVPRPAAAQTDARSRNNLLWPPSPACHCCRCDVPERYQRCAG